MPPRRHNITSIPAQDSPTRPCASGHITTLYRRAGN
jgi:hypothetical protein